VTGKLWEIPRDADSQPEATAALEHSGLPSVVVARRVEPVAQQEGRSQESQAGSEQRIQRLYLLLALLKEAEKIPDLIFGFCRAVHRQADLGQQQFAIVRLKAVK
jgi:hypothetical protein